MDVCICVPIKTINKRLPGKTFHLLDGKPLYSYLFSTLREVLNLSDVNKVVIYSSDEKVLQLAKEWRFSQLRQPEEYTADSFTGDFLIEQIMPNINDFEIIGWLHITSPFLSSASIEKAVSLMQENPSLDSVFGVAPRYNRFWYEGKPVNHDIHKLVRTQDLTPVYEEADFYFFRRDSFLKHKKRVCGNFQPLEVSRIEAVDIDNLEDLLYAEALIKSGLVKIK